MRDAITREARQERFYDGLHFHASSTGSCFSSLSAQQGSEGRIAVPATRPAARSDEHPPNAKLSNEPGTLSMANTGSRTAELPFFRQHRHNSYWMVQPRRVEHPVFGKV